MVDDKAVQQAWWGGNPDRSTVEAAWTAVAGGSLPREVAHDWSVPWVEGDKRVSDTVVRQAMYYLHGFDMKRDARGSSTRQDPVPSLPYYRSSQDVEADLTFWRAQCVEFDKDPAAWRNRRVAAARAAIEAERQRRPLAEKDSATDA